MVFQGRRMQKGGGIASLFNKFKRKGPIGIKTVDPAVFRVPLFRRRPRRGKGLINSMIQKIKKTVKRGGTLFTRHKKRIPHRVINPGLDRWYRSYQKKKGEPVTGLTGYNYY